MVCMLRYWSHVISHHEGTVKGLSRLAPFRQVHSVASISSSTLVVERILVFSCSSSSSGLLLFA
jgi:hypothetical protein